MTAPPGLPTGAGAGTGTGTGAATDPAADPVPNERPGRRHGLHEDQLWAFVDRNELRLQRDHTGRFRYPPGPVSPGTLDPDCTWERLSGPARLVAWTVFRRPYFPEIAVPYTVVVVQTVEGPLLVGHLPGDQSPSLTHGMPMRLQFEDVVQDGTPTRIFTWVPDPNPDTNPSRQPATTEEVSE
jgi:uncharacterized OB-fold protein